MQIREATRALKKKIKDINEIYLKKEEMQFELIYRCGVSWIEIHLFNKPVKPK